MRPKVGQSPVDIRNVERRRHRAFRCTGQKLVGKIEREPIPLDGGVKVLVEIRHEAVSRGKEDTQFDTIQLRPARVLRAKVWDGMTDDDR